MAYFVPANLPDGQHDLPGNQDGAAPFTPAAAARTPAMHRGDRADRPVRVVSMVDGPRGKEVMCEFKSGWQRSISLPTEADAWHPLFDGLPQEQKKELHWFARPAAYVDASGVRKRREGLSFTTMELSRNGGCKKFHWFDVPDEEYGAGQVTGYRAAGELLEALARGYGPSISVGHILQEVFTAREESYLKSSRRGAAAAFSWVLDEAMKFFAKNANFGKWLDGKAAEAERLKAYYDKQAVEDKAAFVQRMKDAKAAKKAARQGGAA